LSSSIIRGWWPTYQVDLVSPHPKNLKDTRFICSWNRSQGLASFITNGPPVQKVKQTNERIRNRLKVTFSLRKQEENKVCWLETVLM
jgi:hypothetical protein